MTDGIQSLLVFWEQPQQVHAAYLPYYAAQIGTNNLCAIRISLLTAAAEHIANLLFAGDEALESQDGAVHVHEHGIDFCKHLSAWAHQAVTTQPRFLALDFHKRMICDIL